MTSIKIFIDSDVILDFILAREELSTYSNQLIEACEQRVYEGYTTSIVLANVYYVARKSHTSQDLYSILELLLAFIEIIPVTKRNFLKTIHSKFTDFEDGLQSFACIEQDLDCIITRNIKDYKHSDLRVCTPRELLAQSL